MPEPPQSTLRGTLVWLSVYAIAMAFFESAVVVYLRELYYPEGFAFPLKVGPLPLMLTELGREGATILMLVAVGALAGGPFLRQFAAFAYCFGIWDIFYYVWLKVLIHWPASILEWDILFLIPVPWIGPVLAPVLVSIGLILAAVSILGAQARGAVAHLPPWFWILEILAGLVIIATFAWDFRHIMAQGMPRSYPWSVFLAAMVVGLGAFGYVVRTWRVPAAGEEPG